MVEIVDVRERRRILRWDGDENLGRPLSDQELFARIPVVERRASWIWDHDWSASPAQDRVLDIRPPSVRRNTSVTWDGRDRAVASDALLLIDSEGYQGVAEGHGVLRLCVEDLPSEPFSIEDQRAERIDDRARRFRCCVWWAPYRENIAHAEIVVFEGDEPAPGAPEPSKDLPKQVKTWFRKTLLLAVGRRAKAGHSPIAIHPSDPPQFTNADTAPL